MLQSVRGGRTAMLGDGPAILAVQPRDHPSHQFTGTPKWFVATKSWRDAIQDRRELRNRQDLWIGCVGAWPVYGSSWWASCSALSWWMALSMASGSVRSMPLPVRAAAPFLAGPQAVSLSKASSKTGR